MERFKDRATVTGVAAYDAAGRPLAATTGWWRCWRARRLRLRKQCERVGQRELQTAAGCRCTSPRCHCAAVGGDRGAGDRPRRVVHRVANGGFMAPRAAAGVAVQTVRDRRHHSAARCARACAGRCCTWRNGCAICARARRRRRWCAGEFEPLAREVTQLASSLSEARAAAEDEARLRDSAESTWTTERLRVFVENRLGGTRLFAVSNREPYEHRHRPDGIESVMPASGLVTALEPILRACDGTWIAQGTGDADRETVDELRPPARSAGSSAIHAAPRLADAREEEQVSTSVSPTKASGRSATLRTRARFSAPEDWEHYREVNRKFAERCWRRSPPKQNPGGAGAGLSLRAAAAHDQGAAAGRARGDLLAHSVAQSGGLRHLPVAARVAGRAAGRRPDRLPHSGALQ